MRARAELGIPSGHGAVRVPGDGRDWGFLVCGGCAGVFGHARD